jgi:hypothetical protein
MAQMSPLTFFEPGGVDAPHCGLKRTEAFVSNRKFIVEGQVQFRRVKCEQLNNFQKKMLGNGTRDALMAGYGGRSPGPTSINTSTNLNRPS